MKTFLMFTGLSLVGLLSGCATSSKVQEMIDASHKDQQDALQAHASSIGVLKQSSVALIEQNRQQTDLIKALEKRIDAADAQLKPMQGNAEAAKVMSAANTVKVAELADAVLVNREAISQTVEKMDAVDHLIEQVLIAHYQRMAESANEAISVLKADDIIPTNGASDGLADPIEIVAPDTSGPTDAISVDATAP